MKCCEQGTWLLLAISRCCTVLVRYHKHQVSTPTISECMVNKVSMPKLWPIVNHLHNSLQSCKWQEKGTERSVSRALESENQGFESRNSKVQVGNSKETQNTLFLESQGLIVWTDDITSTLCLPPWSLSFYPSKIRKLRFWSNQWPTSQNFFAA